LMPKSVMVREGGGGGGGRWDRSSGPDTTIFYTTATPRTMSLHTCVRMLLRSHTTVGREEVGDAAVTKLSVTVKKPEGARLRRTKGTGGNAHVLERVRGGELVRAAPVLCVRDCQPPRHYFKQPKRRQTPSTEGRCLDTYFLPYSCSIFVQCSANSGDETVVSAT
jgi:hypothetical protein